MNVVADAPSGEASCTTGAVDMVFPVTKHIYLTGDLLPARPGIQPCPACEASTCHGGPANGLTCTPGSTGLSDAYPTSQDCPPPTATIASMPFWVDLTTGVPTKTAFAGTPQQARTFCGYCRDGDDLGSGSGAFEAPARPCTSGADCPNAAFPDCEQRSNGAFGPNGGAARPIAVTGQPAGDLRDDASHPATLVTIPCVPPTFNATVDAAADLPGPAAVSIAGSAALTR